MRNRKLFRDLCDELAARIANETNIFVVLEVKVQEVLDHDKDGTAMSTQLYYETSINAPPDLRDD